MADLTIWISGADFIKMGEFLAEEGSNFGKPFWLKSAEILDFSRQMADLSFYLARHFQGRIV